MVLEVVVELLIMGTGRVLIQFVRPKSEPSDLVCGIIGILFWVTVGSGIYVLYRATAA